MAIIGKNQLIKNLDKMAKRYGDAVVTAGLAGGRIVQGRAIKSIQSLSSGETVKRYKKGRAPKTLTVSRPGDAPNTDTGTLVRSITVKAEGNVVFVGTKVKYGRHLEFGTKGITGLHTGKGLSARPWLHPALEASRKDIRNIFKKVLKQTSRKGIK